jgi:predicted exporter
MTLGRRKLIGWGVLGLLAALGALWIRHLDFGRRISVDVLDLIPAGERSPELRLVRSLASQSDARIMFFELTGPGGAAAPAESAALFARALAGDPAFAQAIVMGDNAPLEAAGREVFNQRFVLLFPTWLEERQAAFAATGRPPGAFSSWLARDAAAALDRYLSEPEAQATQDIIPYDPLLLMPKAIGQLAGGMAREPARRGDPTLVWAVLSASPFSDAGQAPAFSAVERAVGAARAACPGLSVAYTGVNRFAASSQAQIKREVAVLNALSLTAVLGVAFAFIRRPHRGLHLVPVVLFSVLGAWVGATAAFDRIHIIVLVVGSMLTGVSIDYGFYLFMQPPEGPGGDYWGKVRRLAKPLLASCLTTVAGFLLLLFSELPFIRQLGVFVGAGLVSALAAAVIYFSTVRNPFLETRQFLGVKGLPEGMRRTIRRLLVAAWIVALPGLAMLRWSDDIRELDIPKPGLQREDARVRGLFGDEPDQAVYISYGDSIAEARGYQRRLEAWIRSAGNGRTRIGGLGPLLPGPEALAEAGRFRSAHPEFPSQLRGALGAAGFDADAFGPFFSDYARWSPAAGDVDRALESVQRKLVGPASLLLHTGPPMAWLVTIARGAPAAEPPGDIHAVSADQLRSLNRIFGSYRRSALRLSIAGLCIVGAGVLASYGLGDGARIFAIPCGACLGLFGLYGWLGHPLNLFHLLGAFLGVCLTHNYSIFSATSAYRREPPPPSVRISALTAAASFGVLALSAIPVVHALGATVASMVIVALVVIEFEHLAVLGKEP